MAMMQCTRRRLMQYAALAAAALLLASCSAFFTALPPGRDEVRLLPGQTGTLPLLLDGEAGELPVLLEDTDGNGIADLLVGSDGISLALDLSLPSGSGNAGAAPGADGDTAPPEALAIDMDEDGRTDAWLVVDGDGLLALSGSSSGGGNALYLLARESTVFGLDLDGDRRAERTLPSYDPVPPPDPSGLIDTLLSDSWLSLSWTPGADDLTGPEEMRYIPVYSPNADIDDLAAAIANGVLTEHFVYHDGIGMPRAIVQGLMPNTSYDLGIIAMDSSGNQSYSSPLTLVTALLPADTTPPDLNEGSGTWVYSLDEFSLELQWNRSSEYNVNYYVYYSLEDNLQTLSQIDLNGTLDPGSPVMDGSYLQLTGLAPETRYWLAVVAEDTAGNRRNYRSSSGRTLTAFPGDRQLWTFDSTLESDGIHGPISSTSSGLIDPWGPDRDGYNPPGALPLDGTISVDSGLASVPSSGSDFAISLWLNPFSAGTGLRNIIFKDGDSTDGGTGSSLIFALQLNEENRLRFLMGTEAGPPEEVYSDYTLYPDSYTHVVAQKTGSSLEIHLYGNLSGSHMISADSNLHPGSTESIIIGRAWEGAESFVGLIDQLSWYDRALSPGEIDRLLGE